MTFDQYIGIDYSGAATAESRLPGLRVFAATDVDPQPVPPPSGGTKWCRREVAEHLIGLAQEGPRFVAGIDHGFSYPQRFFEEHDLAGWAVFLDDFAEHWPTHEAGVTVGSLLPANHDRTGGEHELRLCEEWTSSASSVFDFRDLPGRVAKSTHAGIPWLKVIRDEVGDRVHFWPFDGWDIPAGMSVIAEVYPSIFRHRYGHAPSDQHQRDAYAIARWLKETSERGFLGRYLEPPLTQEEMEMAMLEGWILGVA